MTRTYQLWLAMVARGTGVHNRARYFDKGVRVCDRWRDFNNFLADMGDAPPGLTLDRINNAGNYEPGNVRWATMQEQANNRSNNRVIEHDGRSMTLSQWARHAGIKVGTLDARLKRGWGFGDALSIAPSLANRRS